MMTVVLRRTALAALAATATIAGLGAGVATAEVSSDTQRVSAGKTTSAAPKRTLQRVVRAAPRTNAPDPQGDISPDEARRYFRWSEYINKP